MKVVVVIPAYNEVTTIHDVASRALAQLRDVIVVDDGSTDGTASALDGLPVTLISNPANLGKGASLWRGFAVALAEGADAVVTLDADAQHRPEDIPRLLAAEQAQPGSIVIGARLWDKGKVPPVRYFGNRFASPSAHRSGRNASGSSKYLGSRWLTHWLKNTVVGVVKCFRRAGVRRFTSTTVMVVSASTLRSESRISSSRWPGATAPPSLSMTTNESST